MTGLMQIGGRLGSLGRLATYETETPPGDADNFATLRNVSGSTVTNYPLRFARVFAEGEIPDYPKISVDGTPIDTQADVKTRWGDDSVKHCIMSAIISSAANNTDLELTFQNQVSGNNTPLSTAEMLHADFDCDAVISMTVGGTPNTASLRDILTAEDYTVWCAGQIATTIILADHSSGAAYDMDWGGSVPIRPIFHATFWNASKLVEIRAIAEQADAEHLGDITASAISITKGDASPTSAFSKVSSTVQYLGTRWTQRFWIGTAPAAAVNLNHNLAYLKSTYAFPNYDTDITVDLDALTDMYSAWTSASKNIYDAGLWTKEMPATGGRQDIGPMPTWSVLWLYTGDYRMREVALGSADLAGAWPLHYREPGNITKRLLRTDEAASGTGAGLPISITDRKTTMLTQGFTWGSTASGDRLKIIGTHAHDYGLEAGTWTADMAHQPNAFGTEYLLTGDPFYLEEAQMWAATSAHMVNGTGTTVFYGRGPTGDIGGIYGEVRAYGWQIRNRALAAYLTPDSQSMKEYLSTLVDDALAVFEGRWNITDGDFNGNATWEWANDFEEPTHTNPLHFAGRDANKVPSGATGGGGMSPWMANFFIIGCGMAAELGFSATATTRWLSANLIGMVTDPDYNPYMLGAYQVATGPDPDSDSGAFYTTWQDVYDNAPNNSTVDGRLKDELDENGVSVITGTDYNYGIIACCAGSFAEAFTDGDDAWAWLNTNGYSTAVGLDTSPKWAILPRT
jgi:hypothetical protein